MKKVPGLSGDPSLPWWWCDFCGTDHDGDCPLGFVAPVNLPSNERRKENARNAARRDAIDRLRDASPKLLHALVQCVEPLRLLSTVLGPAGEREYAPGLASVRKRVDDALEAAGKEKAMAVIRDLL